MLDSKKIAYKISFISILVNIFLAIFKFLAGVFAHSGAMLSDAAHSMSDAISPIIVIIGVKLASKEEDFEHPYGHEKMESVAAIILSIILFITGISLGFNGISSIINKEYLSIPTPRVFALFAAIISIIIKESMYWYTRYHAKKINSQVLMADAMHHRTDALSSIGSFIGILASRIGFPIFDCFATILICILILKTATDIFINSINQIIDHSCSKDMIEKIKKIILTNDEILGIDVIKTRLFGNRVYIDIEIKLDGTKSLKETYNVVENIRQMININFPEVKHCMILVNPD